MSKVISTMAILIMFACILIAVLSFRINNLQSELNSQLQLDKAIVDSEAKNTNKLNSIACGVVCCYTQAPKCTNNEWNDSRIFKP